MKTVNRYTSNEFHDWQRDNISSNFVMQDVDTWALVWADSTKDFEPFAIVELKRSFKNPNSWEPYKEDIANYLALKRLADRAELPLWIVYFQKDNPIEDKTLLKIMSVKNINNSMDPWISFHDTKIITAEEFKKLFPAIF